MCMGWNKGGRQLSSGLPTSMPGHSAPAAVPMLRNVAHQLVVLFRRPESLLQLLLVATSVSPHACLALVSQLDTAFVVVQQPRSLARSFTHSLSHILDQPHNHSIDPATPTRMLKR